VREVRADERVWTFIPDRQNGAFIFRRLAMETTIHRWDAEQAHGIEREIPAAFARDGVDEILMQYHSDPGYGEQTKGRRTGQRILLREADSQWCRLITFNS